MRYHGGTFGGGYRRYDTTRQRTGGNGTFSEYSNATDPAR